MKISEKVDASKLLGYRILVVSEERKAKKSSTSPAKLGAKVGQKVGVKAGAKVGVKADVKLGSKVGVKG